MQSALNNLANRLVNADSEISTLTNAVKFAFGGRINMGHPPCSVLLRDNNAVMPW